MLGGFRVVGIRDIHHRQCRDIVDHIIDIDEHHHDTAVNDIVVDHQHQHDHNDDFHFHDHHDAAGPRGRGARGAIQRELGS